MRDRPSSSSPRPPSAPRSAAGARSFLIGSGGVYLVLIVYGSVIDLDSDINLVPVNVADNLLNLVLGTAMLGLGVALGKQATHSGHGPHRRRALIDRFSTRTGHRKEVRHVQGVRMRDQQQRRVGSRP